MSVRSGRLALNFRLFLKAVCAVTIETKHAVNTKAFVSQDCVRPNWRGEGTGGHIPSHALLPHKSILDSDTSAHISSVASSEPMPVTSPLHTPALPSVGRTKTRACLASGFMMRGRMEGRRGEETHKDTSFPSPLCDVPVLPFWKLDAFPNNSLFHGNDDLPEKQRIPPLICLHPVQSATALTTQVTA